MAASKTKSQILAVGGGKGGVGKSTVAANLAVALAKMGRKTYIVDLDLGGANLHTLYGIKTTDRGIGDYIYKPESHKLADYAVETGISNLSLISGNGFIPGIANLEYQRKMKVLKAVSKLDADYVVLDLGAGTSYNVIDFFSMTRSGIIITLPEPTAILNAYEFLKNVLFRMITKEFKKQPEILKIINETKKGGDGAADGAVSSLITDLAKVDAEASKRIQSICRWFRPSLILNVCRGDDSDILGQNLNDIANTYLNVEISYLGSVLADDAVRKSLFKMEPLLTAFPDSPAAESIMSIARKCLGRRWMNGVDEVDEETNAEAEIYDSFQQKAEHATAVSQLLRGHKDSELSSLLSNFFNAGVDELSSRHAQRKEGETLSPALERANTIGEKLFTTVEELRMAPRCNDDYMLPRFISVSADAIDRHPILTLLGYFRHRAHAGHPSNSKIIKQILKVPKAHNVSARMSELVRHASKNSAVGKAWSELGLQFIVENKVQLARTAFDVAEACMPDSGISVNNRAAGMMASGIYEPSYDKLMSAFMHDPGSSEIQYNIGLLHLEMKRFDKAIAWFRQAADNDHVNPGIPKFMVALCMYYAGHYTDACEHFLALSSELPLEAGAGFNVALSHFKADDYARCIDTLNGVYELSSKDADVLALRGLAYWHLKDTVKAIEDLTIAIQIKPANLVYRTARGYIGYKIGKYDIAIEDIETITLLVPNNREFKTLLAEIRRAIGIQDSDAELSIQDEETRQLSMELLED